VIPGFTNSLPNPFEISPHHLLPFHPGLPNTQLKMPPIAGKSKELESQSKLTQQQQQSINSTLNGFNPANASHNHLLPPTPLLPSSLAVSASQAEQLALLHNDPMAFERAKMFSAAMLTGLPPTTAYPPSIGTLGLPSAANPLGTPNHNPLLGPNASANNAAALQAAAMQSALHARLPPPSLTEMQDAMKYAAMFSGLNHTPLNTPLPPGLSLPPGALPDPFKSLTDFTSRSSLGGEQEQLFSRYSILSANGGGTSLSGKLTK